MKVLEKSKDKKKENHMKLFEAYEDEKRRYYIMANNIEESYRVLKNELILEEREESIDDFMIDEMPISVPRIIAIETITEEIF